MILFRHGEADNQLPVGQAEEYFRTIKHFGGAAEMVIFPLENHMMLVTSEPRHPVETYAWRLYWFGRFVKPEARATSPEATDLQ
jgi:dipeptidyl aminopeptidase/acylaminoacyl peptidase